MTPTLRFPKGIDNPDRAEKTLIAALAVAVAAVLALFMALSAFNYPAADDYCFAARARDLGFLGAQQYWYQNWAGRYTFNATSTALFMLGDLFQVYRRAPVVLLIATWLSFSFLTARIARGRLPTPFGLLLGGIWTLLFIAGVPDPAQTFYWMPGSFPYQMANVFLTVLLGLLIWRETTAESEFPRRLIFVVSSLLVAAIIGTNEVSLLLTLTILAGGAFHAIRTRRDSRAFWVALLAIAIGAALVSVLAPGNQQRYAGIEHDPLLRPAPWLAVLLYLPWVALRILYWLSNLGLWASAFVLLVTTFHAARTRLYAGGRFRKAFVFLPAIWIGLIFALNALGFLINRYPLPERAESVIYLLFLLGWYPSFIILGHFLAGDRIPLADRRLVAPAAALLLVSLLGTPNVFEAYKDVYRGYRYAREMRERVEAIQGATSRGETDIVVPSLSRPPRTLFATDLATDPDNHRNQCLRQYYRLRSIRLGSPAGP
jgi:hypothetical protein